MTSLLEFAKRAEKFATDNSPTILTAIGVTGTVTTAVLAGKASFKAAEILEEEKRRALYRIPPGESLEVVFTPRETIGLVWTLYIPAVGTGLITVAAIITANQIGTRRAAVMAAAYSMSEKALDEYKDKVVEKFGENKERQVRDEIAQDHVNRNPVGDRQVIVTDGGEVLCYDKHTGRYFKSSMETIKAAQNHVNHSILNNHYASLNDFYSWIGIDTIPSGEDLGWNLDSQLELTFSTTLSNDQKPCIVVSFNIDPIRNYYKIH